MNKSPSPQRVTLERMELQRLLRAYSGAADTRSKVVSQNLQARLDVLNRYGWIVSAADAFKILGRSRITYVKMEDAPLATVAAIPATSQTTTSQPRLTQRRYSLHRVILTRILGFVMRRR